MSKEETNINDDVENYVTKEVGERLRLIEFCLLSYGYLGRNELIGFFGVGTATATRDFAQYRALCPDNMIYDSLEKRYTINHELFEAAFNWLGNYDTRKR